ncbi:MAG: hypothetical protein FWF28_01220 [Micrococcales bacterium]|nr:hypothetical protein [Micrococcales bacterium]
MSTEHWFVDETKASGLTLVVVAVDASRVGRCRTELAALPRHPGAALRFTKESDVVRKHAFRLISTLPLTVLTVSVPTRVRPVVARERAIRWIGRRAAATEPRRIILERDEVFERDDRRWLREELVAHPDVEYQHLAKGTDPLLWVADGIAWADQRGGAWRSAIEHLIVEHAQA